ncbi:MAG: beta strand repeat-containing protein [Patescibacteria group bacterium]
MNKLRKFLVIGVMVITAISTIGIVAPASASASAGDLIKMSGLSSVYYLGSDGKRYVFPNTDTYMSWYSDFSAVVTIPASELQSYPLGGNVTMRPGTKMVKITTDPSVYAVEPNGVLRKIGSEAQAAALYGTNWNKRIVDVADSFFTNYTVGTALASGATPAGSLVQKTGEASIYYYDGTNYRSIANEAAFNANRFQFANVLSTTATLTAGGTAIANAELVDVAQGGKVVGPVVTGSGVMVSLSSMTPVANDVPMSTSNTLLKFNITAANDGAAVISGVKLTAIGLGDPSKITGISIYKDNVKLNNTARAIDSNKEAQINFTSAVTINAGTTATFEVRATIGDTNKHGLSIAKAADVMAGNTVSGSFPVAGNIFSGANVTVGTLALNNDGSGLSNVKLGDKAATIAKFKLDNSGSIENIVVKAITLKKVSSSTASDSAVENLKLNFDGVTVATAASISSRYVTFNLATPITINKNTTNKRMTVTADVVDGAGKNIGLTLESSSDVVATGDYYGYQSIITLPALDLNAEITAGTISVEKVNATNDKLRVDVDNQEVGSFKVTANSGKNAELSTLRLTINSVNDTTVATTSYAKIENVEVYNKTNNTVYDLTYVNNSGTNSKVYANTSMGLMLTSGVTNELVVRFDTLASATNQEYTVKIASASSDLIIKETGNDTVISDITPNTVELKKVAVEAAGSTFSVNALSTPFVAVIGTSDVIIADFNIKAAQNSKAFMKDLVVTKAAGTLVFDTHSVSDIKLWKGTSLVKTMSSSQIGASAITFTDLNEEIPANTTVGYKVTMSFVKNTDIAASSTSFTLTSATMEDVDGKTISATGLPLTSPRTVNLAGTGQLYVSMDNNDVTTNKATYSVAGTQTGAVASLKLRADNETVKVTKLTITGSTNLNGKVTELGLYDGSTLIGSTNVIATTSVIDISGDKLIVPMAAKNYYVKATLATIGKDQTGALNATTTFAVSAIEAQGYNSGDALVAATSLASGKISYDATNDGTAENATATGASNELGILASKISAVSLVSTNGGGTSIATKIYSGQAANAAIIMVTTGASSNTESNGDAIKASLSAIKVKVATSSTFSTSTPTVVTIERIGGTAVASSTNLTSGYATFSGLTGTDYQIAPSTSAYFLVKVTPIFSTSYAGDSSLTASLDALDTDSITWTDAVTGASAKNALRLGTTKADGTTISN